MEKKKLTSRLCTKGPLRFFFFLDFSVLVYRTGSQHKKWMWFQWAELIQVRKEQCLFKCSECMTMQVHRMNFPMSWEQYWEKAPLLWCDPGENPSCCRSSKRYWFNHNTASLQGNVKLMLADLLPKTLMLHVRLPRVSKACRSMTEKCTLAAQCWSSPTRHCLPFLLLYPSCPTAHRLMLDM